MAPSAFLFTVVIFAAAASCVLALPAPELPAGCTFGVAVPADANTCSEIANLSDPEVDTKDVKQLNPGVSCTKPLPIGQVVCAGTESEDPETNPSSLDSLGLPAPQKALLAYSADFSAIAKEGTAALSQTTVSDKPALAITITQKSPAVLAAAANSGHPAIGNWVSEQGTAPSTLTVTLIPGWFADGAGAIWTTDSNASNSRRLMSNRRLQQTRIGTGWTGRAKGYQFGRK